MLDYFLYSIPIQGVPNEGNKFLGGVNTRQDKKILHWKLELLSTFQNHRVYH